MLVKIFFIFLLIPSISFGANYYVDPTYKGANGSSNGSYSRPWTNMTGQVRAHKFKTGDSLYFRAGTTTVMNTHLVVNWHGTTQNRVIIGTYFGENEFGNGNVHPSERAVLDGNNFLVPDDYYKGMIQAENLPGYVTIQDLEIRDSGGMGITVGNTYRSSNLADYPYIDQYFVIRNNLVYRPWTSAMGIQRSSHNQILNNVIYRSSHGNQRTHPHRGTHERISGASIEISGQYIYGTSEHNTVSGNTISMGSFEGIGFYKRSRFATITNNTVFDCSVNIYIDGSRDIEVSGNIVYGTSQAYRGPNNVRNILLQHEYMDRAHFPIQSIIENVRVFNNYIAGGQVGIGVSVYEGTERGWRNVEIFKNIMVDNNYNFGFWNDNVGEWQNNYIYNNYSFQYETTDGQHSRINSPLSFKWNRGINNVLKPNYFTGSTMPTGNAAQGASFNTAQLEKKTGWRNLEMTTADFSIEGNVAPKKVKNIMIVGGGVGN